jgi:hypothetical protein
MGFRKDPSTSGGGWSLRIRLVLILVALAQLYAIRGQLSIFHPDFRPMYSKTWHGGLAGPCHHSCSLDGWCRQNVEWHGPWGTTIVLDSATHTDDEMVTWSMPGETLVVSRIVERHEKTKSFLYYVTKTWRSPYEAPTQTVEVAELDHRTWRRYPGTVVPEHIER